MKTFKLFIAFLSLMVSASLFGQNKTTAKAEQIKVYGNCEMCQSKIEKAAKSAGATTAKWDVDSKILSVTFSDSKSSVEKIEKSVAAVGYDTEHQTATSAAYHKLPECCQYDRKDAAAQPQ